MNSAGAAGTRVEAWIPGVVRWWAYSPGHKVDLMSHAVRGPTGDWVAFDPIAAPPERIEALLGGAPVSVIVLTNANHERAAAEWRERWDCPVVGPDGIAWETPGIGEAVAGQGALEGWECSLLTGGAPGESAWRCRALDLAVFGDAVVNLLARQLELLPAKYCLGEAMLRRSLERFASDPFARALFAHGDPLGREASRRILEVALAR